MSDQASVIDQELAQQFVERAKAEGVKLTGLGGLLGDLTKRVLEAGLEGEMDGHLGYAKHTVEGRDGGNSRNGTRTKTVITNVGTVDIEVPRDRDGTFDPTMVREHQRRLGGVDDMVLSLSAKGLTRDPRQPPAGRGHRHRHVQRRSRRPCDPRRPRVGGRPIPPAPGRKSRPVRLGAPIHAAAITGSPRRVASLGRALTLPVVRAAIASPWALTWNDLLDGAPAGPATVASRMALGVGRIATARSGVRRRLQCDLATGHHRNETGPSSKCGLQGDMTATQCRGCSTDV